MNVHETFSTAFGGNPDTDVFVPGRVNLIGEHIDYNGGRVLPYALPQGVSVALRLRDDGFVSVASERFEGASKAALGSPPADGWAKYAHYTVQLARDIGWPVQGADIAITSNLSDGAGLSSSAALCVAVLKALRSVSGQTASDSEIAQLARRVENDYIGMPCGIMDQMAVAVASSGEALFLDTASLDFESIPLPHDVAFCVLHSGVHRELADGRYKMRKEECDQAKVYFGTDDLCHLPLTSLADATDLDPAIGRRVRHCITEHVRVVAAAEALKAGRMNAFGDAMNASHISMRDDFEMSVPAIDALVETATTRGALGARLTGGGFGGCIVAAVERSEVERWTKDVLSEHPSAFLVQ
ncbi:MAG: galactokinase [Pseudomonadota bacterium]